MNALPKSIQYKTNFNLFEVFGVTVWFSYLTPVAFRVGSNTVVVHQNDWGPTTGKHLNSIDGGHKSARVSADEFKRLWELQTLRFYGTHQEEPDQSNPEQHDWA